MFKVAVIGGDNLVMEMFKNTGGAEVTALENPLKEAENAIKYDLVVFTGGSDVTPWLYGERNKMSNTNLNRDIREVLWYHRFYKTPKVGICRGGQFLFVMNGGRMEQHIEGHGGSHTLAYDVWNPELRENSVTSTHHQHMSHLAEGQTLLAHDPRDGVNEVIWSGASKSLSFQPHPEYNDKACERVFFWYVNKLLKLDFAKKAAAIARQEAAVAMPFVEPGAIAQALRGAGNAGWRLPPVAELEVVEEEDRR